MQIRGQGRYVISSTKELFYQPGPEILEIPDAVSSHKEASHTRLSFPLVQPAALQAALRKVECV
jgi:hypothetical protein